MISGKTFDRALTIGVVCVLVTGSALAWKGCSDQKARERAEASSTFSEARTKAAQDASKARDDVEAKTQQIEQEVQDGRDAIRNAQGDSNRQFVASCRLCRINAGSRTDCRVFLSDPRCVA